MFHVKQVEESHGIRVGDTVTVDRGTMTGIVRVILKSSLWTNGGVPMARVEWSSGTSSKVTITKLKGVVK